MRTNQFMVPSLGALLLTALIALVGCGAPSLTPGADRGEVGVPPDAAVADRTDAEDHPVVPDAGDESVADASVPADVLPDAATDAEPTDSPDAAPLPPCGQTVAVTGERCSRPFPPGMTPARTAVGRFVCAPQRVTVSRVSAPTVYIALSCDTGDDRLDYLSLRDVVPGWGMMPCVGTVCFYYRGPTYETPGIEWDMEGHAGTAVVWPAGVTPGMGPSTPMPENAHILYDAI